MRISDWRSDVCSSDLPIRTVALPPSNATAAAPEPGAPYPVPGRTASAPVPSTPAPVATPKPTPAPARPATVQPLPRPEGKWRIQPGAFSNEANARRLWEVGRGHV